jgi:hypothetical protein
MGKSQNFEELETPHIIIVEDKTIKWLISDLIKKINGNYNIIEKNENIDYVKKDLSSLLCKPLFSFFNSILIDIYQLYPHNRLKVALKY